jgi:hypothetical protein
MRPIGFSTGALAGGDVSGALSMLDGFGVDAVELSALRDAELPGLVARASEIEGRVAHFRHVSVHAPSRFPVQSEAEVVAMLRDLVRRGWPVVVHPDVVHSVELWKPLGSMLWIENMDKRKPVGRTALELAEVFRLLPDAGLCFDVAHARQVDPSMVEAFRILRMHGQRVRQIHVSEVSTSSKHTRLTPSGLRDYHRIVHLLAPAVPVILESPVLPYSIIAEMEAARSVLEPSAA